MNLSKTEKEELQVLYHKYIDLNSSFKELIKNPLETEDYEKNILEHLKQGIPLKTEDIFHQLSDETHIPFEYVKSYISQYTEDLINANSINKKDMLKRGDMLIRGPYILYYKFKNWLHQPINRKYILPAYNYAKNKEGIQNVILSLFSLEDCKKNLEPEIILSSDTLITILKRNDIDIFNHYYPLLKHSVTIDSKTIHSLYWILNIEPEFLELVYKNNVVKDRKKPTNYNFLIYISDRDILSSLTKNHVHNICTILGFEINKNSEKKVKKILFSKYLSVLGTKYHEDQEIASSTLFKYIEKNIVNRQSYNYFYEKINSLKEKELLDKECILNFDYLFKMKNLSINLIDKKTIIKIKKI